MNTFQSAALGNLLHEQPIATLGTVHSDEPFVSMVPFAFISSPALLNSGKLIIHVSTLAAHTQHMLENACVSLMVMAAPVPEVSAQATPRLAIQGVATQLDKSSAEYQEGRAAYILRFPQSTDLFGFTDFSLFAITPTSARFVAGFAQAMTLTAADLNQALLEN